MDEVKVTIETADGQKHELTGVTAICFTIKEITKDREGNMSVCGGIVSIGYRTTVRELSSALGGLVSKLIEGEYASSHAAAAVCMHDLGRMLLKRSAKVLKNITPQECEEHFKAATQAMCEDVNPEDPDEFVKEAARELALLLDLGGKL